VSSPEKAALVREAGADEAILYTEVDFVETVRSFTKGNGVHVVYDSVGKTTYEGSLNVLRPLGMLVLFGQSGGPVPPDRSAPSLPKGFSLSYLAKPCSSCRGRRQLQQPRHKSVKLGCTEIVEPAHRTYLSFSRSSKGSRGPGI
jgi:NADPH:quinone reductase-like Zn-dependent oxidoreductase